MADTRETTAQTLGAFNRELAAEGIDVDVAKTLVIEAARMFYRDNDFTVSGEHVRKGRCGCLRCASDAPERSQA